MNDDEINVFEKKVSKKKENLCEIGFWILVVFFITSLFGFYFGWLFDIVGLYLGVQGLKTRKRVKAIASIILFIINIVSLVIAVYINYPNL